MYYEIFIGLVAIIGLLAGAEIVIDRSMKIAKKLQISGFFIGLTVFSIGTSLPEIAVHIISSLNIFRGAGDMEVLSGLVLGMNIGSNIAQITLITGIVTLFGTLKANKHFLRFDYMAMVGAIVLLFLLMLDGGVSRFEGLMLLFLYGGYLLYLYQKDGVGQKIDLHLKEDGHKFRFFMNILMLMGGLSMLLLSAEQISTLAEIFSERYGISGSLMGTTLVGLTTSLPELTTAIMAIRRKSADMSLGTLVGSNITNPLMGIGLGALISGYVAEDVIVYYDLPFYFGISALLGMFMWKKLRLNRFGGIFLVLSYFGFVLVRLEVFGT